MVNFYIQDDKLASESNLQKIIYAAQEEGAKVHSYPYCPFGEMDYHFLTKDEPVVALGSISVAKDYFERNLPFKPFCWSDFNKLACSHYYTYYGEFLVQEKYLLLPLQEIIRKANWLYDNFGLEDKLFIKPDTNDKAFTGGVVKQSLFESWATSSNRFNLVEPHQLCVVSSPEKIYQEWRLIISDKKVITGSSYSLNGMLCEEEYVPEEIKQFAEKLCEIWVPHPIFVMDIGQTEKGIKLIEIGSVNYAGFYKCDTSIITRALIKHALRNDI